MSVVCTFWLFSEDNIEEKKKKSNVNTALEFSFFLFLMVGFSLILQQASNTCRSRSENTAAGEKRLALLNMLLKRK